jgi:hypothetical protein
MTEEKNEKHLFLHYSTDSGTIVVVIKINENAAKYCLQTIGFAVLEFIVSKYKIIFTILLQLL